MGGLHRAAYRKTETKAEKQAGLIVRRLFIAPVRRRQSLCIESDDHCPGLRAGNNSRAGYPSSAFGILAAHKMARAGPPAQDFAASGNLDPFLQSLVSFLFRH